MFSKIVDDEITLALVQPSFAKEYWAIVEQQREYLSQWLAWPQLADGEAFFLKFIKNSLHDYADGKSLTCAILYLGQVVGNISFNSINHSLKKVEIGYWLRQDYQGKGIVTRAVASLIEIAFNELAMQQVQIAAAEENLPSRAVCERLGFTLEGIISRAENLNGRVVDHAVYGLSRKHWLEEQQ